MKRMRVLVCGLIVVSLLFVACPNPAGSKTTTTTVSLIAAEDVYPASGEWNDDSLDGAVWTKTSAFSSVAGLAADWNSPEVRTPSFYVLENPDSPGHRFLRVDQPYGESAFTWYFDDASKRYPEIPNDASTVNVSFDLKAEIGTTPAWLEVYAAPGSIVASALKTNPAALGSYLAKWESSAWNGAPSDTADPYPDSFTSGAVAYERPDNVSITDLGGGWARISIEMLDLGLNIENQKSFTVGIKVGCEETKKALSFYVDNLVYSVDGDPLPDETSLALKTGSALKPAVDQSWNTEAIRFFKDGPVSGISKAVGWDSDEYRNAYLSVIPDPYIPTNKLLRLDQGYGNSGIVWHFNNSTIPNLGGKTKADISIDVKAELGNTSSWFELSWAPGEFSGDEVIDDTFMKGKLGLTTPFIVKWDGDAWGANNFGPSTADPYTASLPANVEVLPIEGSDGWSRITVTDAAVSLGKLTVCLKIGSTGDARNSVQAFVDNLIVTPK